MMKLFVLASIATAALCMTIEKAELIADEGWQLWKSTHNAAYADFNEEKVRYTIWQDNVRRITQFNRNNKKMSLGMNHFGDMTTTEFKAKMNGYLAGSKQQGSTFMTPNFAEIPDSVDWRKKDGYVSEVKNQGQCGSCWAFSTTGALEGQHFRKTGQKVDLSEQNLVDCSKDYGNYGCQGGLMDNAFKYIKANGGIDTEKSYPYEGKNLQCRFKKSSVGADDTGFVDIPKGNEDALKNASATVGPISVAIDASHFSFQFYKEGVYDEPQCSSTQLDHGVLVVGYGSMNGQDYWIVKNSWGPGWGLKGYIMMSRNKNDQCGIASSASYPLV
ncbi:procathepsin L-like [Clytia hemisphaerica]|uniref:Cathepsin L n=1 Tax=Clytia hemisphaerica TaxID=252671 RepID=A0A7M5V5L3_9CNID